MAPHSTADKPSSAPACGSIRAGQGLATWRWGRGLPSDRSRRSARHARSRKLSDGPANGPCLRRCERRSRGRSRGPAAGDAFPPSRLRPDGFDAMKANVLWPMRRLPSRRAAVQQYLAEAAHSPWWWRRDRPPPDSIFGTSSGSISATLSPVHGSVGKGLSDTRLVGLRRWRSPFRSSAAT